MKKIGIFIPVYFEGGGGTLRLAKNIVKTIHSEAAARNEPLSVVFGNIDDRYRLTTDLADLGKLNNVEIRPFSWKRMGRDKARRLVDKLPGDMLLRAESYCVPQSGRDDFLDCDMWIFISDRIFDILLPLKKTAIFATDYIQRYVPEIFGASQFADEFSSGNTFLRNARNADYLFVSSPGTYRDALSYAGKFEGLVFLEPTFDPDFLSGHSDHAQKPYPFEYLAWVTNGSMHKNHFRALEALDLYYEKYGGTLKVVMTGVQTNLLSPERAREPQSRSDYPYHIEVRQRIAQTRRARENLVFAGNVAEEKYSSIIRNACFLWHNAIADNGTFSVVEAAYYGVPSLSSDYPQQRYLNDHFGLGLEFFDPFDVEQTAKMLSMMETKGPKVKPDLTLLEHRSWAGLATHHYNILRNCLEKPRVKRIFYS